MKVLKRAAQLCAFVAWLCLPALALAGYDEGLAAYKQNDFAVALKEWRPLAEKGDAKAQYNLGIMYRDGRGVPQDYKEGTKWYRLAADQGEAVAQLNLGIMYEKGEGVPLVGSKAIPLNRFLVVLRHT